MGCMLGIVAAMLPSLLCGLAVVALGGIVREWLEGWQALSISFLGQEVATVDLVQFLNLEQLLHTLQRLGSVSVLGLILAVLFIALVSGLLLALIITLMGLAYNLLSSATGGVVVELSAENQQRIAAASPANAPDPPQ
jgi:hypothetical protein